jgi:hypothetical protein
LNVHKWVSEPKDKIFLSEENMFSMSELSRTDRDSE